MSIHRAPAYGSSPDFRDLPTECPECWAEDGEEHMPDCPLDDVRGPDAYPFSNRPSDGVRECPICTAHIADPVYAVHWEAVHPEQSAILRRLESDPVTLDRWADAGFPPEWG